VTGWVGGVRFVVFQVPKWRDWRTVGSPTSGIVTRRRLALYVFQ
jgi:hypothetical protein